MLALQRAKNVKCGNCITSGNCLLMNKHAHLIWSKERERLDQTIDSTRRGRKRLVITWMNNNKTMAESSSECRERKQQQRWWWWWLLFFSSLSIARNVSSEVCKWKAIHSHMYILSLFFSSSLFVCWLYRSSSSNSSGKERERKQRRKNLHQGESSLFL